MSFSSTKLRESWIDYLPAFARKRLEGRKSFQNILANTGWLFLDTLLRMGVGLVVGVWIARYLGPEQYGILSYALAFVGLFSSISGLGLENIAVREMVHEKIRASEILGTGFVLKFMAGILASALAVLAIFVIRPADRLTISIVAIIALGYTGRAFDTVDLWFKSQVQSKFAVYGRNAAHLLVSIGRVVLILAAASLAAFAWMTCLEIYLGALGAVIAYRAKVGPISKWRFSLARGKNLLHDSWPLILSSIVIEIYLRIDQVILGQMAGNREVGIYSVAVRLAEIFYFVPMVVNSSVFPSIVNARKIGEEIFYSRLQRLYNAMAFAAYAVAIPMTILAGWIVTVLFGAQYREASPMLAVLIWASLFVNLGVSRSSFLTTMNWTKFHFISSLLGCIVNVSLCFLLIPRYGGMGAVIASLVAYWFQAHGTCFLHKPTRKTGIMLAKAMVFPRIQW